MIRNKLCGAACNGCLKQLARQGAAESRGIYLSKVQEVVGYITSDLPVLQSIMGTSHVWNVISYLRYRGDALVHSRFRAIGMGRMQVS